jgi:hypothetical protein
MSKQNEALRTSNLILHDQAPAIDGIAFFELGIVYINTPLPVEV